ncbi:MAG: serine/threonine protein kinase [Cytophagales bacterium]|nr:MAG: serine/threonine protein kinase [Cytophagales bacterium]
MIGEKVINYQIEALIGQGGMGNVYKAIHTQLGREVAIKVLSPTLTENEDVKQRFRNEAATLSQLQHLNIVALYDYLEDERGLFLIMEYVKGNPLDQYVKQISGPIPEEKLIPIFVQILNAMEYAHQKGIVHRDMKPANILLNEEGNVKILDFGIAKILQPQFLQQTQAGTKVGTVLYMSPEQVQGKNIDARSDIYALGLTLFELLTAKLPYDEAQMTDFQVYEKIIKEPLPHPNTLYPAVSDRMHQIIQKATAKNPDDRFNNCNAFKEALLNPNFQYTSSNVIANVQNNETNNRLTQLVIKETQKTTQKTTQKVRPPYVSYAIFGILGIVSIILIWNFFGSKTPSQKETTIIAENNENSNENENSNANKDKEKSKDAEEKSPEELLSDSLNKEIQKREKSIKAYEEKRKKDLLNGIVVDAQFEGNELGEYSVQVTVVNLRKDAQYENVSFLLTYFDDKGEKVEEYEHKYGTLKEGKTESISIKRSIEASKFTCKLKEADVVDSNPPELPDSLQKKQDEIKDLKKQLKKINEKENKE